eukprot:1379577-Rhodomonas_salina.1
MRCALLAVQRRFNCPAVQRSDGSTAQRFNGSPVLTRRVRTVAARSDVQGSASGGALRDRVHAQEEKAEAGEEGAGGNEGEGQRERAVCASE